MANGSITVKKIADAWYIKASGNASFEYAPALRELNQKLQDDSFSALCFDMDGCAWMDSTFMGMVALVSLAARRKGIATEMYNASDKVKSLLNTLGLTKLLTYKDGPFVIDMQDAAQSNGSVQTPTPVENAYNVLEAHKTLMDVDESNVARFTPVVDLVQKDIDRIEHADKENS